MQTTKQTTSRTIARFLHRQDRQFLDEFDIPREGDTLDADCNIIRYRNGFLHAVDEPAIDCKDGHMEYWENGRLHRDGNRPAVISADGGQIEYWMRGRRVE